MRYIKRFFRKIKIVDVVIAIMLLIALSVAGYVQIERTKEMSDTLNFFAEKENQTTWQNDL